MATSFLPVEVTSEHQTQVPTSLHDYLKLSLGRALASCMVELSLQMPEDPIDFMARWLYRYVDFVLYTQEKASFLYRTKALAAALAKERRLRHERMHRVNHQFKSLKGALREMNPSMFKSLFHSKDGKEMFVGLGGREGLHKDDDKFLPSSSSSKGSLPMWTSKITRADILSSKLAGKMRYSVNSEDGVVKRPRHKKKNDGEGDDDSDYSEYWEDDDGVGKSPSRQNRLSELSAKDSLVTRKKLPTRESSRDAYWVYEQPPGVIVCVHPLLGKLKAKKSEISSKDLLESYYTEESPCESLYNHELYVCLSEHMLHYTPAHGYSEMDKESAQGEKRPDLEQSSDRNSSQYNSDSNLDPQRENSMERESFKSGASFGASNGETNEAAPQAQKVEDDGGDENGDDDLRWQDCESEEVCEGWRRCEGFPPDGSEKAKKK